MIQLYAKGTTDFSVRGITLAALKGSVTFQDNGRFDLDVTVPVQDGISYDYGMILRASVPEQHVPAITLGTVSYYTVTASAGSTLWSAVPTLKRVRYKEWTALRVEKVYAVGDKVSYLDQNYRMIALDPGSEMNYNSPPNNYPEYWEEISNYSGQPGKAAAQLTSGTTLMKTADFNSEYIEAATLDGKTGYIRIADVTATGETETRVIPAQTITAQSFEITEIEKSLDGKQITLHAEHVSYGLGRCVLGDCSLVGVNPATALLFIQGAMKEEYAGGLYTNLTEETITADWSWKNAQSAILDPKAGLLQFTAGQLIRNDRDVYLISKGEPVPKYQVTYGTNLRGVTWDGGITDMVTRVYPTAQAEDGRTILLPEEHIDTVRVVPFIRPEVLNTGLKVGTKEKQSDGTEIELTESIVYDRMREAANNRFNVDECDKADIRLEVDWIHLPDTEEYKQYSALKNAAPGEWVQVTDGPLGIYETIQLTGYTWDAVQDRYEKATFGKNKVSSGVASYDIQTGAVTGRALAAGSVNGQNLQANTITAREIEAGSVTADKIASRSIQTDLLAANAITANEIAAEAVTAAKIHSGEIKAYHIGAKEITADQIKGGTITAALIAGHTITADQIAGHTITADEIAGHTITAYNIAGHTITADELDANSVTANAIAAGTITATKIDTQNLDAWHATLHTARVDNGYINNADINYARIKDAALGTAIIDTSITEQGIADRLYINRLLITYGQMVEATIGDLVIGASDGNYYHVDVEWDENGEPTLVPTQVQTPSPAEIAAGHTTGGKTIIGNIGTFAELSSENFYAINSIIDRITAKRIDVDQLWAREAFVNKLMVQDISSNTYIQSTIGDWQGGSTITQTINGINTRISTLGYGTFFYSPTPPDPSGVVVGDVWVEPIEDRTWDDVAEFSWDELGGMTWEQVAGQYRMYVWTGNDWKLLFDNMIVSKLQTQINQNAYAITLKADESLVDTLSGEVTTFAATLEVQAEEISSAVSAVNAKTANYTTLTDPADDPSITLKIGDTWTRTTGGTWDSLAEFTWDDLAGMTWDEIGGVQTFVWTGTGWLKTGDTGSQLNMKTLIDQTAEQIGLIAEKQMQIGDQVYRESARITVQSDRISQEVERATTAENGKIAKTSQYQTADEIVSEAVSQAATSAGNLYVKSTRIGQTANDIIMEAVSQAGTAAGENYIAKAGIYVSAEAIKNEAVRVSGVNATNNFIQQDPLYKNVTEILAKAKSDAEGVASTAASGRVAITSQLTTADMILNNAVAAIDNVPIFDTSSSYNVGTVVVYQGAMYKFTSYHAPGAWNPSQARKIGVGSSYIAQTELYQTADAIVSKANDYVDGQLVNYSTIDQTSTAISAYVRDNAYGIQSGIDITAEGIDISGSKHVIIESGSLFKVSSPGFGIDSTNQSFAIWAGAANASSSPFKVTPGGVVYMTKMMIVDDQGQNPREFNPQASLWKIGSTYKTVKTVSTSGGYCSSMTFSDNTTVNFKSAASVVVSATVSDAVYLSANNSSVTVKTFKDDVEYSSETHIINTNDAWTHGAAYGRTQAVPSATVSDATVLSENNSSVTVVTYMDGVQYASESHIISTRGAYDLGVTDGSAAGWATAYGSSYSVRNGATISAKIPAVTYGQFSSYNYDITISYVWANVGHLTISANVNGTSVAMQTVRANKPA